MRNVNLISGLFMIPFLLGMGSLALKDAAATHRDAAAASPATVLNGSWAAAYEKTFNKKTHIYDPSVSAWAILNYVLFGEGRDGVLVGGDGWLFTREEFDYIPRQDDAVRDNIAFIRQAQERLAKDNIGLLVVMIPAKARVYDEHLGRYRFPSYRDRVYGETVRSLRNTGVPVADPLPAMERAADEKPLFLKTDTHWTPDGAALAARVAAERIRAEWPGLALEKSAFHTVHEDTVAHRGDLLRYLPLGPLADDIGPGADTLAKVRTEKSGDAPADAAGLLFGAESLPVTLVGTSYSANPAWNFAGFLEENLQTGVLNAAKEGQGPFETMRAYLADESLKENPPRLVVWEIPERYLPVPYNAAL